LHSETHKVLEYLIRVYEINAFQKETILLSFIPYFETSTFLRLIQTLNLKDDYKFLEDYAYKGQAIPLKVMIKALGKSNGHYFLKYATFCFQLP
jgi:hypothetical protein